MFWDNVGNFTPLSYDIVNSDSGLNMFTEEIDAKCCHFYSIQSTGAFPWIKSSMGCLSRELNLQVINSLAASDVYFCLVTWVPSDAGIQIIEETVSSHVQFPPYIFLGRASIQFDSAWNFMRFDEFFESEGSTQASGPK